MSGAHAARVPDAQRARRRARAVPEPLGALVSARPADGAGDLAPDGRARKPQRAPRQAAPQALRLGSRAQAQRGANASSAATRWLQAELLAARHARRRRPSISCRRPAAAPASSIKPMIMGLAKLHFIDAKLALDQWRTNAYLAPLSDDGAESLWSEAQGQRGSEIAAARAPGGRRVIRRAAGARRCARAPTRHGARAAQPLICTRTPAPKCSSATRSRPPPRRMKAKATSARASRSPPASDAMPPSRTLRTQVRAEARSAGRSRTARAGARVDASNRNCRSRRCRRRSPSARRSSAPSWAARRCPPPTSTAPRRPRAPPGRIGRESGDVDRADDKSRSRAAAARRPAEAVRGRDRRARSARWMPARRRCAKCR